MSGPTRIAGRGQRSASASAGLVGLLMLLGLGSFVGCSATGRVVGDPPSTTPDPLALPSYARVAAVQNSRVAMLVRLWAAASAIVTYQDQDGQIRTEQAEGYLQLIQPNQVALSLGKQITTQVYFYLGSNEERYWWMDRLDPERRIAFVGTHEAATPERAAKFGAPVHPLDLVDLLGITPLPDAAEPRIAATGGDSDPDSTLPEGSRLAWSPDRTSVVVDVPGRFGTRRTWFDPETLRPRRVEILDERGRVAVYSTLARDVLVSVRGDSRLRPMMAENVEVFIPGTRISIRLLLDRLENRGDRQGRAPFDLDRLLGAYPVDRIEDLDALELGDGPDQPPAAGTPGGPGGGAPGVRTPDRRLRVAPGG